MCYNGSMIQQQIVDYVKTQIQAGVAKETVKDALLKAGWPEADVNDSIGAAESSAAKISPPVGSGTNPATTKIVVSELFSNSQLEVAPAISSTAKETPIAESGQKMPSKLFAKMPPKNTIIMVAATILIAGFAAASVFLYLNNRELNGKLSALAGESGAADSKATALSAQITTLTQERDAAGSQLKSAMDENKEINFEFSFVAAPQTASGSAAPVASSSPFVLKGMMGGGGKTFYGLTTARGLRVYIKNSAMPKVDAALKGMLGKETEISGTYEPGSPNVTVSAVNGVSVQ